jgi:hypothetical protein
MVLEPGNLSEIRTPALEEWEHVISRHFRDNRSEQLLAQPDDRTPGWPSRSGAPIRHARACGRS